MLNKILSIIPVFLSLNVYADESLRDTSPSRDYNYEFIVSAPVGTQYEGMGVRVIGKCDGKPVKISSWEVNSYISKHETKTGYVKAKEYKVGYDLQLTLGNCNEILSSEEITFQFSSQHLESLKMWDRKVQPTSQEKDLYGKKAPDYGRAYLRKALLKKVKVDDSIRIKVNGQPVSIAIADGGEFRLSLIRR